MRRTYAQAGTAEGAISLLGSPRDTLLKNPVEKYFHATFTRIIRNPIAPKIGRGQHFQVERVIVVDLADEFGHFSERTKASEIDVAVGIEGMLHEGGAEIEGNTGAEHGLHEFFRGIPRPNGVFNRQRKLVGLDKGKFTGKTGQEQP